ncbi:MAG TPA: HD domain-containing phosphohydrolase [Streptosporangiaceae bacterium]|nr:HD domain-containing phosphohydrolase [Streptosporangiaceae bacterium]
MTGSSLGRGTTRAEQSEVRLAELVASLSLGIDLGFGQPMEHVLRQCLIALRIAERIGLDAEARAVVYYTALLVNVGCHVDAHEQAKWFGDDIGLKSLKYEHDPVGLAPLAASLRRLGRGHPPLHRFRIGLEFAVSGFRDLDGMIAGHAELARSLATEIGLPADVQAAIGASYERWDGRGWPGKLRATAIPLASRLAQIAEYIEVAHRIGGEDAAVALARKRHGAQFDPDLADLIATDPGGILGKLSGSDTWDAVIGAEPALSRKLSGDQLDAALLGVANFVDLKSPYMLGHASAVAALAGTAGELLGLPAGEVATVRRASLVSGFGRLGISNSIWDKPGPLGAGERERVRMQPYLTERMLQQSSWLAPLGAVAVQLRERMDGSGYPRGLSGSAISVAGRVLGAADAYQSMREPRPYRDALSSGQAAAELRADATAGRLATDAVESVLSAAGHPAARRAGHPAGLTAREVDVLRLLARGMSSRQIADRLVISPKTARNHVEHIYVKIGASSRVTASLFAVRHGLLPDLA